jgi:hypothetical protein
MPEESELPVHAVSRILRFDVFYLWLMGILETTSVTILVVAGKS